MVKIKNFTLAFKLGGGHVPSSSYTPPAHGFYYSVTENAMLIAKRACAGWPHMAAFERSGARVELVVLPHASPALPARVLAPARLRTALTAAHLWEQSRNNQLGSSFAEWWPCPARHRWRKRIMCSEWCNGSEPESALRALAFSMQFDKPEYKSSNTKNYSELNVAMSVYRVCDFSPIDSLHYSVDNKRFCAIQNWNWVMSVSWKSNTFPLITNMANRSIQFDIPLWPRIKMDFAIL